MGFTENDWLQVIPYPHEGECLQLIYSNGFFRSQDICRACRLVAGRYCKGNTAGLSSGPAAGDTPWHGAKLTYLNNSFQLPVFEKSW